MTDHELLDLTLVLEKQRFYSRLDKKKQACRHMLFSLLKTELQKAAPYLRPFT